MFKTLLLPIRAALGVLFTASLLVGCEADSDTSDPVSGVGPTHTTFSMVDSMKVDPAFRDSYPDAYQKLRGKTYQVAAQDKMVAYFYEENNGITLYFKDTSLVDNRSWVSIHFKNRTLQNLPATLSLKDATAVGVQNGQTFADESGAMSPGFVKVLDGTVSLQINEATKTISGQIANLKLGLDYYVPTYAFPNREGTVLRNSGSSRNLNLVFDNLKKRD
ncbi:hypothetical protein [Rufibacter psychrotolerans]|uniref:hypothetical protein n=1 Tax=Rufibacter psychrotolerans TaxID=2812556 RepID=UPI001967652C|nr:hypothetical protein [Rufibacter sp. SYSU D00308]